MTLTIVIILVALLGIVMFGYSLNKNRSVNKDDAMKSGEEIRHDPRK